MQLTNFSSLIEIFVGLDLTYAGSKNFRNYIFDITTKAKDLVSLLHKVYLGMYNYLTRRLSEKIEQTPDDTKYKSTFEKYKEDFEKSDNFVVYISFLEKDFTNRFKSLFFVGSLGGLLLLFICGYQHDDEINIPMLRIVYVVSFTISFYGLFIFVYSLFSNKIDRPVNIFLNCLIIVLLLTLSLKLFNHYYPYDKIILYSNYFIVFGVLSTTFPFLLYFLRITVQFCFSILYLFRILAVGCCRLFYISFIIWAHRQLGLAIK